MKGRIFELEEQVKDINYLEGKNKELLNDNLALLQLKIEAEYELHSFQERYKFIFDNLKEEISLLQDDNEEKRNINSALYEENIIFKSEKKKLLDDLREQHEVIKELQRQKTQFELTIHNISKTLIETRDENEKLLKQNNIRSTLNKQYSIKRYEQWDYRNNNNKSRYNNSSCDISNDKDNDRLIEENAKLKRYILLIANHNQKVFKII